MSNVPQPQTLSQCIIYDLIINYSQAGSTLSQLCRARWTLSLDQRNFSCDHANGLCIGIVEESAETCSVDTASFRLVVCARVLVLCSM